MAPELPLPWSLATDGGGCPPFSLGETDLWREQDSENPPATGRPSIWADQCPSACSPERLGQCGLGDCYLVRVRALGSGARDLAAAVLIFFLLYAFHLGEVGLLGNKGCTGQIAHTEPSTRQGQGRGGGIYAQTQTRENQHSRPLSQNCWKKKGRVSLLTKQHWKAPGLRANSI